MVAHLTCKLQEGQPRVYTDLSNEEPKALEKLNEKLILPAVLALLRLQGTYEVDIDACDRQIGCVLL